MPLSDVKVPLTSVLYTRLSPVGAMRVTNASDHPSSWLVSYAPRVVGNGSKPSPENGTKVVPTT